jgi:hypothetical protein
MIRIRCVMPIGCPTVNWRTGRRSSARCAALHSVDGANGLVPLTETWSETQLRLNIAKLQRTKPFMPPFAGNAADVEAVVQWLRWQARRRPDQWTETSDPAVLAMIEQWLREAGTEPGLRLLAKDVH